MPDPPVAASQELGIQQSTEEEALTVKGTSGHVGKS